MSPYFFDFDNLINVFRQSSVNALLALGQLLVIITAGIDLSVGSILGLFLCVGRDDAQSGRPLACVYCRGSYHRSSARHDKWVAAHKVAVAPSFIRPRDDERCARTRIRSFRRLSYLGVARRISFLGRRHDCPTFPGPVILVARSMRSFIFFVTHDAGAHVYAIGGNKQAQCFQVFR